MSFKKVTYYYRTAETDDISSADTLKNERRENLLPGEVLTLRIAGCRRDRGGRAAARREGDSPGWEGRQQGCGGAMMLLHTDTDTSATNIDIYCR